MKQQILPILICAGAAFSQVYIELEGTLKSTGVWEQGPAQKAYNNTVNKWWVSGWRYTTSGIPWNKLTGNGTADPLNGGKPYYTVTETPEGFFHEGRFSRPDQYLMAPNGTKPITLAELGHGWTVGSTAGLDGTPFNNSIQLKLFERGTPPLAPSGHAPIPIENLKSYISGITSYYKDSHRYLDTMGIRGGDYSGGFYDTFGDETQLNLAVPGDTFTLSVTPVTFKPSTAGGPIYWMALAMMQEYFSEDMQFQMSIGFKETMAGLASDASSPIPYIHGNKGDNTDKAFGPFEVEGFTYTSQAMYYPHLYPKYREKLAQAGSEGQFAAAALPGVTDGVYQFTSEYCGPATKAGTPLNSPYVIGCMLGSYGTFQRIYDILANANKICFKEMLSKGQDRWIAAAALAVLYNRGISTPDSVSRFTADSAFDVTVYRKYLNDPKAQNRLPMGNSLYREHVLELIHTVADWNVRSFNDPKIPIYDEKITLNDLKAFFFGEGGDVSKQGGGGMCTHFTVDRQKLWADVEASYKILSEHWGGTHISLRYDWITMMRSVKQHFSVKRALRPTTDEAARWVANANTEPNTIVRDLPEGAFGCDSIIVDKTAPYTALLAVKTGTVNLVQISGKDAIAGVKEMIWCADRGWDSWKSGIHSGGTVHEGTWIAEIPASEAGSGDTVWVGLVDSSGNADIREVVLKDKGTVGTIREQHRSVKGVTVQIINGQIMLNNAVGTVTLKMSDLRGREICSLQNESVSGTARFTIPETARGAYFMTIETADQKRSIKILH